MIGLLPPAHIGSDVHRYYDEETEKELLRLQQSLGNSANTPGWSGVPAA
ncbi:hypothetical protein [Streptomyces collinus]